MADIINTHGILSINGLLIGIIMVLLLLLCVVSCLLYKYRGKRKKEEQDLNQQKENLEVQANEKTEKLYHINNQLYEEIAKHEDTTQLLIQTRNYLQNMINSMPSILIGITREGIVTHWNSAAHAKTTIPYSEALGKHFQDLLNEPNIKATIIEAAIDKQKIKQLEAIQEGSGSNTRFKDITIYPLTDINTENAVIRIDDVTTRVHLESMLIQNEKMASLGELAAGVAHEINNPLGTILQSIQTIKRRLSDELPANKKTADALNIELNLIYDYLEQRQILSFIDNIKEAGERAASIVTNMLEFSGKTGFQHDPIQLSELINRSLDLAISSSSLSKEYENIHFSITRELPETCPAFYGSAAELQQVILNIINNAYQAFSEHHLASTVDASANQDRSLETGLEKELEGRLDINVTLSFTDEEAKITIQDNGPGMDAWTKRHIFEPFFTTKEMKKGTGLGLSVSYFIITEHHRGNIIVDSELGKGTTFTITMPLTH